ncbi:hypothetical protein HMPREF9073_02816 [Capnocytophaga sp. oral taxon 326 str. F0382]|nr:hypothetical protein HMPREF9073_02816 [Capnocytophaga sp. oral taxon 326 str. F0382]
MKKYERHFLTVFNFWHCFNIIFRYFVKEKEFYCIKINDSEFLIYFL